MPLSMSRLEQYLRRPPVSSADIVDRLEILRANKKVSSIVDLDEGSVIVTNTPLGMDDAKLMLRRLGLGDPKYSNTFNGGDFSFDFPVGSERYNIVVYYFGSRS